MHAGGELGVYKYHPKAVESLVDEIAKKQTFIRRGGLSGAQIKKIKSEVVKSDPTLTSTGKKLIQKTLTHLSGNGANQNKPGQFIYKGRSNVNSTTKNQNEHAITSITAKFKTATVHQTKGFTKQGEERAHTSVSISSAIKNTPAPGTITPAKPSISNTNFNPIN